MAEEFTADGTTFNDGPYDAGDNPNGFANGGHRHNLFRALRALLADATVGLSAVSTTELTVGTGTKLPVLTEEKEIATGAYLLIVSDDGTKSMYGQLASRVGAALNVTVTQVDGAGTDDAWSLYVVSPQAPAVTEWNTPIVVANADSPVAANDKDVLLVRTSTGAVEVDLPASGRVKIVDVDGSAELNNITIDPPGADTATFDIVDSNYFAGVWQRRPGGTNWDLII